jgi:putative ABC transport system ATP-binding protein
VTAPQNDTASSVADAPVALLNATGLVKSFGVTPALRGADLVIRPGEIVAVMGSSGSGKSTLLHCAAGIVQPEAGSVAFDGEDLTCMSDRDRTELRRTEFGFIFQFGQLIPELTCLQNVAMPLRLDGMRRKPAEVAAAGWLDHLDVGGVAGSKPGEISGGQAQRVAVARALIGGPSLIFADEPTGALDTLQGEKVMGLLTRAVRETGAALVLVTHEPRVAAYSDREVVVRDGRTSESRDPR